MINSEGATDHARHMYEPSDLAVSQSTLTTQRPAHIRSVLDADWSTSYASATLNL